MDSADGYWQMVMKLEARWHFAYMIPLAPSREPTRLAIPRALKMGWNGSLVYFCKTAKMVCVVAQEWISARTYQNKHPIETFTSPTLQAR
jgi:hypothetical protein